MRCFLAGGLSLAMGLSASATGWAQSPQRAVGGETPASSIAVLGRPTPVTLGKPEPIYDGSIQPAGFRLSREASPRPQQFVITEGSQPLILAPVIDTLAYQDLSTAAKRMPGASDQLRVVPRASDSPSPPPAMGSAGPIVYPSPTGQGSPIMLGQQQLYPGQVIVTSPQAACGPVIVDGPIPAVEGGMRLAKGKRPFWHEGWDCEPDDSYWWLSGEYLLWYTKSMQVPPLVSYNPSSTTPAILGSPGTTALLNGNLNYDVRSGFRLGTGIWLDDERTVALEGSFFFLGKRSVDFTRSGDGNNGFLGRPFFNTFTGREDVQTVAGQELLNNTAIRTSGTVNVHADSQLWGAEANLRWALAPCCKSSCWHLDWLTGFRFVSLEESLGINEYLTSTQVVTNNGMTSSTTSLISVSDSFRTQNNFYGGQMGLDWGCRKGRWNLDFMGKVALGSMHQIAVINGGTTNSIQNPSTAQGGLLALSSNIGRYNQDRFAVIPEAGVKLGWQVTDHMRLTIGYSFLYLSNVLRPGQIIDRNVSGNALAFSGNVPTSPRPIFRETDFWAQGASFGLEFRY